MKKISFIGSIGCAAHVGLALLNPPSTLGFATNFAFAVFWALSVFRNTMGEASAEIGDRSHSDASSVVR